MDGLVSVLAKSGFKARKPNGSFFLYVKAPIAATVGNRPRVQFKSAEEVSQWLITEKFISTVPWDDAGPYLRFSVTFVARDLADENRILGEIGRRLSEVRFEF